MCSVNCTLIHMVGFPKFGHNFVKNINVPSGVTPTEAVTAFKCISMHSLAINYCCTVLPSKRGESYS